MKIPNNTRQLHVYQSYRTWLKHWKRQLFDAFRRGCRIYFRYDNKTYSTTVAQLNYIYWAETYGILSYLQQHHVAYTQLMTRYMKNHKKQSIPIPTTCIIYEA